jgi:hypothetical protein
MKQTILFFMFFLSVYGNARTPISKFNFDFEQNSQHTKLPDHWFQWGSYEIRKDSVDLCSGKYSSCIVSDEKGSAFGCVAYKIPANYSGKEISLQAYLKTENVENGFAGLLLRIDGKGSVKDTTLAFDNMKNQHVNGTRDWQKYNISLPFPKGAKTIFVGGLLAGKGKAWFDNFTLSIDGKNVQTLKEVKKSERGSNIVKDNAIDQTLIPLANITVSPANIAQPGSGVENIADGKCVADNELFHTLWAGIPRQDITIEADLRGKGKRLDKIILTPRGSGTGGNGIIKTADVWVMAKSEYKKIATVHEELTNEPVQIELEKPILNPRKIKLVITDSYGDMYSDKYMVSLGELECRTMPDAAIRQSQVRDDSQWFTNAGLSLKPGITGADIRNMKVPLLKKLATELYNHTYQPGAFIADYKPYLNTYVLANKMHISDGFSKYEGITGVVLNPGDNIIYVGETKGAGIRLSVPDWTRKTVAGIQPDKDPEGWGLQKEEYALKEGLNLVHLKKGGNAYIQYFVNSNPADYPPVKVHFLTGKVNGYFDITRGDTNEDFNRLLNQAASPILDIRGKHIQIAFPVESLKRYSWGKGVELAGSFDSIVGLEKHFIGWEKEGFFPKNHILARINYQYFMFRDGDGMAFVDWAMEKVADPQKVISTECWGISHEMGHVFQMYPQMTWGGMNEVSNNILTMYSMTKLGNKSRLVEESRYANAKEHILDKGISYLAFPGKVAKDANIYGEDGKSTNVFERLVPFWQLYLYFKEQGYEDFYPDLMIAMRKQAPLGGNDPNKSYLNMLEFCRLACIVSKTDLTDFFQRWGFFYVGEINVVDYYHSSYQVTQNEIDTLKNEIANMKLPKPRIDITTLEN